MPKRCWWVSSAPLWHLFCHHAFGTSVLWKTLWCIKLNNSCRAVLSTAASICRAEDLCIISFTIFDQQHFHAHRILLSFRLAAQNAVLLWCLCTEWHRKRLYAYCYHHEALSPAGAVGKLPLLATSPAGAASAAIALPQTVRAYRLMLPVA